MTPNELRAKILELCIFGGTPASPEFVSRAKDVMDMFIDLDVQCCNGNNPDAWTHYPGKDDIGECDDVSYRVTLTDFGPSRLKTFQQIRQLFPKKTLPECVAMELPAVLECNCSEFRVKNIRGSLSEFGVKFKVEKIIQGHRDKLVVTEVPIESI